MKTNIVTDISPPISYLGVDQVMGQNAVSQSNCMIL